MPSNCISSGKEPSTFASLLGRGHRALSSTLHVLQSLQWTSSQLETLLQHQRVRAQPQEYFLHNPVKNVWSLWWWRPPIAASRSSTSWRTSQLEMFCSVIIFYYADSKSPTLRFDHTPTEPIWFLFLHALLFPFLVNPSISCKGTAVSNYEWWYVILWRKKLVSIYLPYWTIFLTRPDFITFRHYHVVQVVSLPLSVCTGDNKALKCNCTLLEKFIPAYEIRLSGPCWYI